MRSAAVRGLSLALAGSLALGAGCGGRLRRTLKPSEQSQALDRRSPFLKVHARDGGLYVLSEWRVDEAERLVSGRGEQRGPNREVVSTGSFTIPLGEVALFETNVVHNSPAVTGLAVITGISLAVTAACLANPKACFGSCPTFYVTDGRGPVLQAEGFSSSIAPSLEARDLDALYRAHHEERSARDARGSRGAAARSAAATPRTRLRHPGGQVLGGVGPPRAPGMPRGRGRLPGQGPGLRRRRAFQPDRRRRPGPPRDHRAATAHRPRPPRARDRLAAVAREHVSLLPVPRFPRRLGGREPGRSRAGRSRRPPGLRRAAQCRGRDRGGGGGRLRRLAPGRRGPGDGAPRHRRGGPSPAARDDRPGTAAHGARPLATRLPRVGPAGRPHGSAAARPGLGAWRPERAAHLVARPSAGHAARGRLHVRLSPARPGS